MSKACEAAEIKLAKIEILGLEKYSLNDWAVVYMSKDEKHSGFLNLANGFSTTMDYKWIQSTKYFVIGVKLKHRANSKYVEESIFTINADRDLRGNCNTLNFKSLNDYPVILGKDSNGNNSLIINNLGKVLRIKAVYKGNLDVDYIAEIIVDGKTMYKACSPYGIDLFRFNGKLELI